MKEILVILQNDMVAPTLKMLEDIGITGMTVRDVLGRGWQGGKGVQQATPSLRRDIINYYNRGKELVTDSVIRNNREIIDREIKNRFFSRKMIILLASDEEVISIIYRIINLNNLWNRGRGRIFIFPVSESILI
jgi:nitrogen regulatory protein PII